jgi:hypothetical protein
MGNRLTKVNNGVSESYTYNAANMLLTRGANSYTNDANGNMLTGGYRANTWDSQNQLVQCVYGANASTFTYAADGLRHRAVQGTTITDYVLDSSMFARELRNGVLAATYLVGPREQEYRLDDANGILKDSHHQNDP